MKPEQIIRSTLSGTLSATAKVLSVAADVTTAVARRARPSARQPAGRSAPDPGRVTPEVVAEELPATGASVSPPPTEPVPDAPSRVRTSETHVAELADRTAADLVDVISALSTDELRLLYEHESEHKNRKTVLQAIEKALTPAGTGG